MFGWCLFFLVVGYLFMAATRPASFKEINSLASAENLRATKATVRMARPNEENLSFDAFSVWGMFFMCLYQRGRVIHSTPLFPQGTLFETIDVTILGHRKSLAATFQNEKLTAWAIGGRLSTDIDEHSRWILEHLLATIQNAVSTNLVPSQHEAIPRQ